MLQSVGAGGLVERQQAGALGRGQWPAVGAARDRQQRVQVARLGLQPFVLHPADVGRHLLEEVLQDGDGPGVVLTLVTPGHLQVSGRQPADHGLGRGALVLGTDEVERRSLDGLRLGPLVEDEVGVLAHGRQGDEVQLAPQLVQLAPAAGIQDPLDQRDVVPEEPEHVVVAGAEQAPLLLALLAVPGLVQVGATALGHVEGVGEHLAEAGERRLVARPGALVGDGQLGIGRSHGRRQLVHPERDGQRRVVHDVPEPEVGHGHGQPGRRLDGLGRHALGIGRRRHIQRRLVAGRAVGGALGVLPQHERLAARRHRPVLQVVEHRRHLGPQLGHEFAQLLAAGPGGVLGRGRRQRPEHLLDPGQRAERSRVSAPAPTRPSSGSRR